MERDLRRAVVGLGVARGAEQERFVVTLSAPDHGEIWQTFFYSEAELRSFYQKRGLSDAQTDHDIEGARKHLV